jgi:ABC-type polysaccharide/polyol phosphate transport system ATPase subunit
VSKRYEMLTAESGAVTRFLVSRAHAALHSEALWALRGIDLEIAAGDMVAIIGPNGAGKTTLLRVMAGITEPTEGTVETNGRLMTMLEVGAGFHPELTGYENVYLLGAVQGLTHRQITERLPGIIAFSELGEFMEMPLKHHSSGMQLRLGFSLAIHCEPDIIMVDETLAVGDGRFQVKCVEAMTAFHRQGKTILFVTHNVRFARSMCDETIWLDHGRIVAAGPSGEVALAHMRALAHEVLGKASLTGDEDTCPAARVTAVTLTDAEGTPRETFRHGETFVLNVEGVAEEVIEEPDLRFTVVREDYEIVGVETARAHGLSRDRLQGPFRWAVRWPEIFLNTADYSLGVTVLARGQPLIRLPRAASFRVEAPHMENAQALSDVPCVFTMRR